MNPCSTAAIRYWFAMTGSSRPTRSLCTTWRATGFARPATVTDYGIAAGVHPTARVLGTTEQQQDLTEALELKKRQEREAKAGIRQMTETVILPEARQRQIIGFQKVIPATEPARKIPTLSATEKAAIEAAKAAGAQARAELDSPAYEPSIFKRFPDEPARYKYLFEARYERGCELIPEDAAFMEYFEDTPQFQRNFRSLYEDRLELLQFKKRPIHRDSIGRLYARRDYSHRRDGKVQHGGRRRGGRWAGEPVVLFWRMGRPGRGKSVAADQYHYQRGGAYVRVWEGWTQAAFLQRVLFEVRGKNGDLPRMSADRCKQAIVGLLERDRKPDLR